MQISDLNWRKWLKNGDQYLKAATPKKEKSRFDANIRYNLLSMALEGYIMAILDFHSKLPDNHTYTDLMAGLGSVIKIDEELKARILSFENIQSICSLDKYHRTKPSEENLIELKAAVMEIGDMAHITCKTVLQT